MSQPHPPPLSTVLLAQLKAYPFPAAVWRGAHRHDDRAPQLVWANSVWQRTFPGDALRRLPAKVLDDLASWLHTGDTIHALPASAVGGTQLQLVKAHNQGVLVVTALNSVLPIAAAGPAEFHPPTPTPSDRAPSVDLGPGGERRPSPGERLDSRFTPVEDADRNGGGADLDRLFELQLGEASGTVPPHQRVQSGVSDEHAPATESIAVERTLGPGPETALAKPDPVVSPRTIHASPGSGPTPPELRVSSAAPVCPPPPRSPPSAAPMSPSPEQAGISPPDRETSTETAPTPPADLHETDLDHVIPTAVQDSDKFSPTAPRPRRHTTADNFKRHRFALQMRTAANEYSKLLHSIEWSKTRLGPYENWSASIKTLIQLAFSSATQDSLWIGDVDDLHVFYNQHYSLLVNHPHTFGKPVGEVWPQLWPMLKPLAQKCYKGESIYHHEDLLLYRKNDRGRFLERYHTWSFVPIYDENDENKVVGLYNMSLDTTQQVLGERRLETTVRLVEDLALVRNTSEFLQTTARVLESNPMDVPFALFYRVEPTDSSNGSASDKMLTLDATIGVPEGHKCAPQQLPVRLADQWMDAVETQPTAASSTRSSTTPRTRTCVVSLDRNKWPIARALATQQCVIVDNCSELIEGLPVRQWEELPDSAIVVPIVSEASNHAATAVLILGLNLYADVDSPYTSWIQIIRGHLVTALNAMTTFDAVLRRRLEMEKLERAKSTWFRGAAHEFRTPLTLISGPLDDVLGSHLDFKQRQTLQIAQRNVARLQNLVGSLLDFTRVEAGHVTARCTLSNLGEFVTSVAGLFRQAIERQHLSFTLDIEPRMQDVCFDSALFEMVLSNLLSNALKYTEEGSITIQVRYDASFAYISVIDTGRGIPADQLDMVTEMFQRATDAESSGIAGTGIGLAIAKQLIKLHHGELLIKSETGERHGTVMTATMALDLEETEDSTGAAPFGTYGRRSARDAMLEPSESKSFSPPTRRANRAGSLDTTPPKSPMDETSKLSVSGNLNEIVLFDHSDVLLIADDNADMREYLRFIFEPFVEVVQAWDGEQALDCARSRRPNLILSDFLMPGMSGLEIVRAVRNDPDPDFRYTPIVLLSAVTDDETRLEALVAGAEDYVLKPFTRNELLARVHLHMQMGKTRAKLERLFAQRTIELGLLSDYCPSGILRTDADGRITYTNAAFWELLGDRKAHNSATDLEISQLWHEHCTPETWVRLRPLLHGIMIGNQSTVNLKWKWDNGRTMSGVFIRLDVAEPKMALKGVIACVTDVTDQEDRLEEAERLRVEAEEAKHQQELLVDFTSHEIRTPVSAILHCSALVKENLIALQRQLQNIGSGGFRPTPQLLVEIDEDIGALESIHQCGLVQERIAGDVLSLARIQLDMLTLCEVEVDMRAEAYKALRVFASEAKLYAITLLIEFGRTFDSLPHLMLKTDPVRLGQVMTNLISNAIRFTASAEVRRITVSLDVGWLPPPPDSCARPDDPGQPPSDPVPEDTPMYLFVNVEDTGPGMLPEEQANLFQRFHQGNKMIHTRYGGSGLGLFICKRITELLGGRIEVRSTVGEGSKFRFFVQVHSARPQPPDRRPFLRRGSSAYASPTGSTIIRYTASGENFSCSMATGPSSDEPPGSLSSISTMNLSPAILPEQGAAASPGILTLPVKPTLNHSHSLSVEPSRACALSTKPTLRTSSTSPALKTHIGTGSKSTAPAPPSPATTPKPKLPNRPPLHVLIVEDSLINQTVLARQMVKSGNTCETADNGQQALDAVFGAYGVMSDEQPVDDATGDSPPALPAGSNGVGDMGSKLKALSLSSEGQNPLPAIPRPFDVVLMDLEMPIMDGLTALRHLRDAEAAGTIPSQLVIALTGNARQGQIDEARAAGMDDVLTKPYRLPHLLATMSAASAVHRARFDPTPAVEKVEDKLFA